MFDFIALDFETANQQQDICSVGASFVVDGKIEKQFESFINPEKPFSNTCIAIHGITQEDVTDAPTFPEIFTRFSPLLRHYPIVAHGAQFERSVITHGCERYSLQLPHLTFYCTSALFQYNYPNYKKYKLDWLCEMFGIPLMHHNALSDSAACANLFLQLLNDETTAIFPLRPTEQKRSYSGWNPIEISIQTDASEPRKRSLVMPNIQFEAFDSSFEGKRFVLTGEIGELNRDQFFDEISNLGGKVIENVSSKTDYVVVGAVDLDVVKDKDTYKTGKVIKAESIRESGGTIKIVSMEEVYQALQFDKMNFSDIE
ncbi:exonuclease domain-containing protein [Ruthenibacterium lactatiformans]|uniref:exonuclease domain-containing protein n=1 Tax=Ruthenibacterium lactatiformans TaxID=1550024 RepID=UPI00242C0E09|nr:exonuclease domain-containing protein [Ruthenibacterium lactatiformans]